ncbi:methanogen output domain 1-containing protein [Allohahella marinimesophila]|uniref:Methanogen output domain 1-containing protein n=1 Tax=Allohahella marinimesophila TaxID=1054972 RepID=A0ABP7Q4X1_9GAMM
MNSPTRIPVKDLSLDLERDVFLRSLIRELAGTLQDVIGLEEAAGFVSVVGQRIGDQLNQSYRQAIGTETLSRSQVAEVLVDLKRRIKGDFFIIEESDDRLVFGNRACPFAEKVIGRPSMCMMTSNVFGVITAENTGYARVELKETIAEGAPGCRVVVNLKPVDEDRLTDGREYFAG